jgi:hypothetical protein
MSGTASIQIPQLDQAANQEKEDFDGVWINNAPNNARSSQDF